MGDGRVDTVAQAQLRVDATAFLAFEEFRVKYAGVYDHSGHATPSLPPGGVERVPLPVAVIVRLTVHVVRDTQLLHPRRAILFQPIAPSVRELLGVICWIGGRPF